MYLEALVDADGGVVTIYDSAICADSDCINGSQFSKYWDRIATLEPEMPEEEWEALHKRKFENMDGEDQL